MFEMAAKSVALILSLAIFQHLARTKADQSVRLGFTISHVVMSGSVISGCRPVVEAAIAVHVSQTNSLAKAHTRVCEASLISAASMLPCLCYIMINEPQTIQPEGLEQSRVMHT